LNLEKAVEKCLDITQNLSRTWAAAGFESKKGPQVCYSLMESYMVRKKASFEPKEQIASLMPSRDW